MAFPLMEFENHALVPFDTDQEVNGGFFHVGEGSAARFMGALDVYGYGTRSVPDDGSDFTNDIWDGGCLWNDVRYDAVNYLAGCSSRGMNCFRTFYFGAVDLELTLVLWDVRLFVRSTCTTCWLNLP